VLAPIGVDHLGHAEIHRMRQALKPSSPQALKHGAAEIAVLVQDELGIVNKIM
jgi:hypothetical protein